MARNTVQVSPLRQSRHTYGPGSAFSTWRSSLTGPTPLLHSGMFGGRVSYPRPPCWCEVALPAPARRQVIHVPVFYDGCGQLHADFPSEREMWKQLPFNEREYFRTNTRGLRRAKNPVRPRFLSVIESAGPPDVTSTGLTIWLHGELRQDRIPQGVRPRSPMHARAQHDPRRSPGGFREDAPAAFVLRT